MSPHIVLRTARNRPTQTTTETTQYAAYVQTVESCYVDHPDAIGYYEQLTDHMSTGSSSPYTLATSLQTVKFFRGRMNPDRNGQCWSSPFENVPEMPEGQATAIVVLEGLPSPACIAYLGATWNLRPELFLGHIPSARRTKHASNFYELPSLPSCQDNIIRIHYVSTVESLTGTSSIEDFLRGRRNIEEACYESEKDLVGDRQYGATRFRRLLYHNEQFCSIEQAVSFSVVRTDAGWTAIFLTDQGRSMLNNHKLPWRKYNSHGRPVGTLPLIPFNVPLRWSSSDSEVLGDATLKDLDQFHPLKHIHVRDDVDFGLLQQDPFFLYASLLTMSAMSWNQLLNYMSSNILEYQIVEAKNLGASLERLKYYVGIFHAMEQKIAEGACWVSNGGCPSWPRVDPQAKDLIARKEQIKSQLEADHAHLKQRCAMLARDCESATTLLVSMSQLVSSERGTTQAEEVHHITRLASFFVPISFVATTFSMNVSELHVEPSVWKFVITAASVSCATLVAMNLGWLSQVGTKFWRLTKAKCRTDF